MNNYIPKQNSIFSYGSTIFFGLFLIILFFRQLLLTFSRFFEPSGYQYNLFWFDLGHSIPDFICSFILLIIIHLYYKQHKNFVKFFLILFSLYGLISIINYIYISCYKSIKYLFEFNTIQHICSEFILIISFLFFISFSKKIRNICVNDCNIFYINKFSNFIDNIVIKNKNLYSLSENFFSKYFNLFYRDFNNDTINTFSIINKLLTIYISIISFLFIGEFLINIIEFSDTIYEIKAAKGIEFLNLFVYLIYTCISALLIFFIIFCYIKKYKIIFKCFTILFSLITIYYIFSILFNAAGDIGRLKILTHSISFHILIIGYFINIYNYDSKFINNIYNYKFVKYIDKLYSFILFIYYKLDFTNNSVNNNNVIINNDELHKDSLVKNINDENNNNNDIKCAVFCPKCNQKIFVPLNKELRITCSNCKTEFDVHS